jgi:hypothetical protein
VFLIEFKTNNTQFAHDSKSTRENDQSHDEARFGQQYQFASLGFASCYNSLYSEATSPASYGNLVAVSPNTYRPNVGGHSNIFMLSLTHGTIGMNPQLVCTAFVASLANVPFNGYVQVQQYTQREYLLLSTQIKAMLPETIPSIYPGCNFADKLSPEQVVRCPRISGLIEASKPGFDITIQYDDVPEPLQPVNVTLRITSNTVYYNAHLSIDFSAVQFAAFYGCSGVNNVQSNVDFPKVSFYGTLGNDFNDQVLGIDIERVSYFEIIITCAFLSSRYIQPMYYQSNAHINPTTNAVYYTRPDELTGGAIANRPSVNIPITFSIPSNPDLRLFSPITHESSFEFKSSYRYPERSFGLQFIFDRTSMMSHNDPHLLLSRDKKNRRFDYNNDFHYDELDNELSVKHYTLSPYLSSTEISTLLKWLTTTVKSSIMEIKEGSPSLFTVIKLESLSISAQVFDPVSNQLTIDVGFLSLKDSNFENTSKDSSDDRLQKLFAYQFPNASSWLASGVQLGLALNTEKILQQMQDTVPVNGAIIPLAQIFTPTDIFDECTLGHCGGNCAPCPNRDVCFISTDCQYGLYCHIPTTKDYLAIATTPTGHQENVIIRAGFEQPTGMCRPLWYGYSNMTLYYPSDSYLLQSESTPNLGLAVNQGATATQNRFRFQVGNSYRLNTFHFVAPENVDNNSSTFIFNPTLPLFSTILLSIVFLFFI